MLPRHSPLDFHAIEQLIEHDILQHGIVLQDQRDVVKVVLQHSRARLVLQLFPPCVAVGIGEIHACLGKTFVGGKNLDLVLLHCKFTHRLVGCFVVLVSETMHAHDIKGIAQLQISGVFCVVTVNKLVFLDLHACHAGGLLEMPAILVIGRLVYIRKEFLQGSGHGIIHAVEQANDAFLRQRVLHLLLSHSIGLAFPGGCGKPSWIIPLRMSREHIIRIEPFAVCFLVHEHTVLRRGRPVHQLIRLIGALVKVVNAKHLGNIAGNSNEFFWRNIPRQRKYQPDARIVRCAAVSGIQN